MKDISLEPIFIPATESTGVENALSDGDLNLTALRHAIGEMPFNAAYDFIRSAANILVSQGRINEAIDGIKEFDTIVTRMGEESGSLLDIHAALMQILTSLCILAGLADEALTNAATVLNLLAQQPKRKDEPFLTILASLLYDIAVIHNSRDEHKQAEREIEKSMKLFERLAKINPARYGSAHLMAMNVATGVYQSRLKQANTLTQYQEATNRYLRMVNEGIEGAGMRLIESLVTEGRTLMKMNRQREAVQYFSRALKNLTKLNSDFTRQHLQLSIDLGEALLAVKASRDKGIHLLNTMLYKANKINADAEHRRIVEILLNAKNPNLDIFSFWHKLFPR